METIKGKTWQARKIDNDYVLNIDMGANLVASLEDFVLSENISSGEISGIGAADEVTLAFYNFDKKEFDKETFSEQMEITSAMGNIAYKEDELYIHLHVTLGKSDYSAYAGHLIEAHIHGVAEFFIKTYPYKSLKTKKGDTDMWVYNFDK